MRIPLPRLRRTRNSPPVEVTPSPAPVAENVTPETAIDAPAKRKLFSRERAPKPLKEKKPKKNEEKNPADSNIPPSAKRKLFSRKSAEPASRALPILDSEPAPETPVPKEEAVSPSKRTIRMPALKRAPKENDAAPKPEWSRSEGKKKKVKGEKDKGGTAIPRKPAGLPKKERFILIIGDEGAILVLIAKGAVQGRWFSADCRPDNIEDFNKTLSIHSKAPIHLYLDTLDQSYVQQTLPPVSSLSTGKLIKRRLDREFASVELKGSIKLGRDEISKKDWAFLMVAVDQTPALTEWLDWLTQTPNRVLGVRLLPPESESVMARLYASLALPKNDRANWSFLVSHNKVSGFRQVIFKDGKMIFTRLGQPLLSESGADVAAGSIEQEILTTLEYLKRLSFKNSDNMDLFIIASDDVVRTIDSKKLGIRNMRLYTPHRAAELMLLPGATQLNDRYGDVVMASALSASKGTALKLWTPTLKRLEGLYQVFPAIRGVGALLAIWLIYTLGTAGYDTYTAYDATSTLKTQKVGKQAALDQLKTDAAKTTEDVEAISDTVAVYEAMMKEAYSPYPFVLRLSAVAEPGMRITGIDWLVTEGAAAKPAGAPPAPPGAPPPPAAPAAPAPVPGAPAKPGEPIKTAPVEGAISFEFKNFSNPDEMIPVVAKKWLERIKAYLPGYELQYTSLPGMLKESDKMEISFNEDVKTNKEVKPVMARLTFKGQVIVDQPTTSANPSPPPAGAPSPAAPPASPTAAIVPPNVPPPAPPVSAAPPPPLPASGGQR